MQRKEFFTYFYVYQLVMYMIWFWHSYLVTGSLVFSVVILSGIIKVGGAEPTACLHYLQPTWMRPGTNRCLWAMVQVLMVRKNQVSLKKLTSYVTPVVVLRDAEWTCVQSTDLVPGDLMRVHGEWVMPCDAVILHGAAVCNESTLTGGPPADWHGLLHSAHHLATQQTGKIVSLNHQINRPFQFKSRIY